MYVEGKGMNERIREFAEQTSYIWHASGDPQIYEFTPEKLEKFAELIVGECLTLCEYVADDADETAKSDFVTDAGRMLHEGMWGGAKNCSALIKQHFGIEE
jgi:hypothetical protein